MAELESPLVLTAASRHLHLVSTARHHGRVSEVKESHGDGGISTPDATSDGAGPVLPPGAAGMTDATTSDQRPDPRQPDLRMRHFLGGFDSNGQPVALSPERLLDTADTWRTSDATPRGVADLLRTARNLFVHSWWVYEFAAVAVAWSLLAVERAFRTRLEAGDRVAFGELIKRAHRQGLLTGSQAERLDAGRQLRNRFAHPDGQSVFPYGMSAPMLEVAHAVVADLFPDQQPGSA